MMKSAIWKRKTWIKDIKCSEIDVGRLWVDLLELLMQQDCSIAIKNLKSHWRSFKTVNTTFWISSCSFPCFFFLWSSSVNIPVVSYLPSHSNNRFLNRKILVLRVLAKGCPDKYSFSNCFLLNYSSPVPK